MATIDSQPDSSAATPIRGIAKKGRLEIDRLFEALVRLQGSDLHLKVGQPPFMRVKGSLQPLKHDRLDDEAMQRLCLAMLDERQKRILENDGGCDFAHTCVVDEIRWRFRVNLLYQQGSLGMVARRVNNTLPDF
jgi:twitching motility protein PilT